MFMHSNNSTHFIPITTPTSPTTTTTSSKSIPIRRSSYIQTISDLITMRINAKYQTNYHQCNALLLFASNPTPKMSLLDFIASIKSSTYIGTSTIIAAMIYIDRLVIKGVFINDSNIHIIVFLSILASIKVHEDTCFTNKYYASIAEVSLSELNKMEYQFLTLLNFDLFIEKSLYEDYLNYFTSVLTQS